MNYSPTLTAEEFKTVHNAVCSLDSLCEILKGVINQELINKLVAARDDLRVGLEGAYQQEREVWDRKNTYFTKTQKEHGLSAIWSIYEIDYLYQPHPYTGATELVYKDHWGKSAVTGKILGPLWIDLYRAADLAIRDSDDEHHIFIEAFHSGIGADGQSVLFLHTGS